MSGSSGDYGQHHVVIVGRSGGHPGSNIYLTDRGTRREAIATGEAIYRQASGLASNVALTAKVVFSGTEAEGVDFIERLTAAMETALSGSREAPDGR